MPVSVCIPVRNEEKNLPECLASLQQAFDEVVVVDSASTDETVSIAQAAGATVLTFEWNGQFPKKRNWTLNTHSFRHPWVLFLDADERLTPEFIIELRDKLRGTSHVGFWLTYSNWFMGKRLRHGDGMRKLALFRTEAGAYEQFPESWWSHLDMEVHEHPVLNGSVGQIRSCIEHHDYRGLHNYLARHNEYSTWESNRYQWLCGADAAAWEGLNSRQRFKYRHLAKWWLPWMYFCVAYFAKRGFLDGATGWHFNWLKLRYFQEIRLKILETQKQSERKF